MTALPITEAAVLAPVTHSSGWMLAIRFKL